jgi:hypothetical protein
MQHPILKKRTLAVWDYLKEYMLLNDGDPPAVRDFVRDGVDNITSTSIVQYHLEKLQAAGLIEMIPDEEVLHRRRIKIKHGIYRLPRNVLDDIAVDDSCKVFNVDINLQMTSILNMQIDELWSAEEASKVVIVTDNSNVALIAMGYGFMVMAKAEAKDRDG